MKKTLALILMLALAVAALAGPAAATAAADLDYPNGVVSVILPAKPGGDIDSSGRLLAKDLEAFLGVTLVPQNIADGGGNLAMKQLMDGASDGQQVINYFSYANAVIGGKLEYGWDDVVPVATYAKNDTQILCIRADSPYKTATELVEYM